ncbi:hypothetical protein OG279_26200 [Streptomyces sp. NBC_01201]|uniref:hypothetical protein n=1 Tax=unclassified Streptomyces TaxID=2593676 RepID=UPI002E15B865|nr:hypothetical protein OG725_24450 [Streptomyces sp. NBC_01213]WSQ82779.1 hypothetical protein OG725_37395 [Streptomyces sp. NBC_01213]WSR50912.1 hypothetical protein OG279_26200 [Streptomyces sp. NBC_01201]
MTGIGTALTALIKGSMVLTGKLCGCITNTGRLAWDSASADPEATAARQVKADAAAQQKALKARGKNNQDDEEDLSEVTAPPVPTVRRPALEALGVFALGGALAVGALTAAWRLLSPAASQWWASAEPYHYLITTGIGLAWMVAAWMLAPPEGTADAADEVEEHDEEHGLEDEADRGTELLWHVVQALASAESAGRAGLHLDVILDSAAEAGLIPEDTELAVLRSWVEAAGLPTEDKVGYRIDGKPVTRAGFKIAAVTEALGMTPAALLQARPETPAGGAPTAPSQPVAEPPVEVPASTPAETPVPAVLRLIPGGRQDSPAAAPLLLAKERAQGAR